MEGRGLPSFPTKKAPFGASFGAGDEAHVLDFFALNESSDFARKNTVLLAKVLRSLQKIRNSLCRSFVALDTKLIKKSPKWTLFY